MMFKSNRFLRIMVVMILAILPVQSMADDGYRSESASSLEGIALVKIQAKHFKMEFEQAVVVDDVTAMFVGLDDFGGELFKLLFSPSGLTILASGSITETKGNKLKKILSLPLTQNEFMQVIQYDMRQGFDISKSNDQVIWQHQKYKPLTIAFSDFKNIKKDIRYPNKIYIQYKNNYLDLTWIKLVIK